MQWTENKAVRIALDALILLGLALGCWAFAKEASLSAAVDLATTVEEVDAINW